MKSVGALFLVGMTLLTCVDVVGRFFKHPVFGSVELVTLMGVFGVAFSLPFTHDTKGHIGVELFVSRLSRKTRILIDICTACCSLGFFGLVTWRMIDYALKMKKSGEVSMNLELPEYLTLVVTAFCFGMLSLVVIKGLVDNIERIKEK
ncbi:MULTISPECIES: TRAP transporter small permease [Desulfococcus]|nr:TRAP transporter small permease [Desulfococcus multivorans]